MKYLLPLLFALSCQNYRIEETPSARMEYSRDMLDTVSFKQVKNEVFIPKCIMCHGSAGGVDLESHTSAHAHLDAIGRSALQTKTMPKGGIGPLSDRQYQVLSAWVDASGPDAPRGHQEESPTSSEPVPPQTQPDNSSPMFVKIKKQFLEKKCLFCHKAGGEAGNIPMVTKEDLLSSPLGLLVPGNPEASLMYTITAPGAPNMMPPMGVSPLTKTQRAMLEQWILQGAP